MRRTTKRMKRLSKRLSWVIDRLETSLAIPRRANQKNDMRELRKLIVILNRPEWRQP